MAGKGTNQWIAFLKLHKGSRLKLHELQELYYINQQGGADIYDRIKLINKKINNHIELTDEESKLWRSEFIRVLSNDYKYTKDELLSTYDVWLKRIKYNSGIYETKMSEFKNTIQIQTYTTVKEFLTAVTDFFDIEELYAAEVL